MDAVLARIPSAALEISSDLYQGDLKAVKR